MRERALAFFVCAAAAACTSDVTFHAPDADVARDQACEAQLSSSWALNPPVVGLGTASARQSYARIIAQALATYTVPGGALAVSKDGRLVLLLGVGFADVPAQLPAHADQLWRIASLSKQLTAAGILLLAERGQLSLDDPVFSILTGYAPLLGTQVNPQLAAITIRHLLHHAGGWNRDSEPVGDPMFASGTIAAAEGLPGPATADMIIRYMLDKPLTYAPGTTTCYSNFGYALLGRVIERKTGRTYADFMTANVLGPAGIRDMAIGRSQLSGRADEEVAYYGSPGEPLTTSVFPQVTTPVPWEYGGFYLEAMDAHGGWIASPIDQLRFALVVDGRAPPADLLGAGSRTAMIADPALPACTPSGGTTSASTTSWYGFGWGVNNAGNLWHLGSLPGTATEDVIAANGYAWAVFFDSRPSDSGGFATFIDSGMWSALGSAGAFTTHDLFDQTAPFSAWMDASAWAAESARQAGLGRWAMRVEGRSAAGGAEYRAQFVPRHAGVDVDSAVGLDCLAYRAREAQNAAAGFAPASLQSYVAADGLRRWQAAWAKGF